MAERRLRGCPRKAETSKTAGPVPPTIRQCCTYQPGVKYAQDKAFSCQSTNSTCTSGFPSENCHNRVPTRTPTDLRLTTNARQNTKDSNEASPILCQATPPYLSFTQAHWYYHPD